MAREIWLDPDVEHDLQQCSKAIREGIKAALQSLERDPFAEKPRKLIWGNDLYGINAGAALLIYQAWSSWPVVYVTSIVWLM